MQMIYVTEGVLPLIHEDVGKKAGTTITEFMVQDGGCRETSRRRKTVQAHVGGVRMYANLRG